MGWAGLGRRLGAGDSGGGRGWGGDGTCRSGAPSTRSRSRVAARAQRGGRALVLCAPRLLHRRCGSLGMLAGVVGGGERRAAVAASPWPGDKAGSRRPCGRAAARASCGAGYEGPPRGEVMTEGIVEPD